MNILPAATGVATDQMSTKPWAAPGTRGRHWNRQPGQPSHQAAPHRRLSGVLDDWCEKTGRAPHEIERTVAIQPNEMDALDDYVAAGADHVIVMVGAPYDLAALESLIAWRG